MKRFLCGALCALILILSLSACSQERTTASFQAMDTLMTLTVYGGDKGLCDRLQERISALSGQLDATDGSSEIAKLNQEKTAPLSADSAQLLGRSLSFCEKLGGSFDITVYPAVQAWGFISGAYRVPDEAELRTLQERIDYRRVEADGSVFTLPDDTEIDLGAVAKGYAADISQEVLKDGNAQAAVLNLGGTIKLYGRKPDGSRFKVGIADPENPAGYFGYLTTDAAVVATSGGYERYFEKDGRRYIHILDPKTAKTVDNGVLSVTIVTDDGAYADALSTALFVMGLDEATAYYEKDRGFDFIILTDDGNLYITEGIYGDFSLGEDYDFTLHKI